MAEDLSKMFVRRLGEADYGQEEGRVGVLNMLARSGLPIPEGVILTRELHSRFLETCGLMKSIFSARAGEGFGQQVSVLRREYGQRPLDGELNRLVCEALINLGSRTVAVISRDTSRTGLRTIPQTQAAIRNAWLSAGGLRQQIEAAARGEEIPTWPVLIQREIHCRTEA